MTILDSIIERKVITIVRKVYGENLDCLSKALYDGGIRFIECTFDQVDPECEQKTKQAIQLIKAKRKPDMHVGAGTVLSVKQVEAAHEAGAEFIISPNTNVEVIKRTKELGMISIPGAMTPSEILMAHDAGADLVKLFPAGTLGMKYIKDILAPITHVKLLATGGVTEDNFAEFLKLGMAGAGVSGRLTDKKLIADGDWDELRRRATVFSEIAKG